MYDENTEIILSNLPKSIINKIPFSIRTYKDKYLLKELPYDIQYLIRDNFNIDSKIEYDLILDAVPEITEYGDFSVIDNMFDLITEYVKNYIQIQPGDYPFDPVFGCSLKKYIQRLDTNVQRQFISIEVENIAKILIRDIKADIKILDFTVHKSTSTGIDIEYNFILKLKVNNVIRDISMTLNS